MQVTRPESHITHSVLQLQIWQLKVDEIYNFLSYYSCSLMLRCPSMFMC
jgi:hypothetical protein